MSHILRLAPIAILVFGAALVGTAAHADIAGQGKASADGQKAINACDKVAWSSAADDYVAQGGNRDLKKGSFPSYPVPCKKKEARAWQYEQRLSWAVVSTDGFHVSVGAGGQFDINSSTQTQSIGSAGILDPVNLANQKAGLSSGGVIGQFGIGYDWHKPYLFSGFGTPGTSLGGFVGLNLDVTFGGGSKSIAGIPGIVPFLAPGVASTDTLKFRNDVNIDFTGRIGTYISPKSAVYALGGLSISSVTLKYDCFGFCAAAPATPAFSAEMTKWTYGGVIGAGFETRVDWFPPVLGIDAAATSLYLEYRAHFLAPVTIDVGSLPTRSTSQRVDMDIQTITAGARIRF